MFVFESSHTPTDDARRNSMIEITRAHIEKIHSLLDQGLVNGLGQPEPGKMCVEAAINYALGLGHGDDPGCVMESLRQLKIRLNDSGRWTSNKARAEGLRRLAIAQLGSKGMDERDFAKRVATMTIRTVAPSALRAAARRLTGEHPAKLLSIALKCENEPTEANAREANKTANAAADAAANAAANAANAAANANAAYADAAAAYVANANAANAAAYAAAAAAAANAANAADAANAAANAANAAANAYAATYATAYATANAAEQVLVTFAENVVQILIEMKAPGCQWLDVAS
jgi:hypothetical protein